MTDDIPRVVPGAHYTVTRRSVRSWNSFQNASAIIVTDEHGVTNEIGGEDGSPREVHDDGMRHARRSLEDGLLYRVGMLTGRP